MTVKLLLLLFAFVAWCLWGVDWRRCWPILAMGGWIPLVLIGLMTAVVWWLVFPSTANVLGLFTLPNRLWQLAAVALLICLALFCGWLQGLLGWHPPAVSYEPAPPVHDDHHHAH